MDPLRHVKPSVRALAAYTLALREAPVKINQNENPWDLAETVKRRVLERALARPWSRYPDFDPKELLEALARFSGWRKDGILAGNGSNEAIEALLLVTVSPGTKVVIPEPTFTLYALMTTILGGEAVRIPVEVGGGIRTLEDAQRYRDLGAERVIFGTAAVSRPDVVQAAVSRWPEAVAVAIDARDGRVAVSGWNEITEVDALDLAATVEAWGVVRVQFTDVRRDGTLIGPNLEAIEALGRRTGLRITAAGGVSDIRDLVRLAELAPFGVDEAIVGKAVYEGRVSLSEARKALAVGKATR